MGAFVQCRDDRAIYEVPRMMPPDVILPDSPTPTTAERFGRAKIPTSADVNVGFKATTSTAGVGTSTQSTFSTLADGVKKTRSQMDQSPQPSSPQPDRSAQLDRAMHERDTNAMHWSATANSAAYVGPEIRTARRSAQESRDDVNAMHQKTASAMFATGSRDEAVRRDEAGTLQGSHDVPNATHQKAAAVFTANAGLKVEASTDVTRGLLRFMQQILLIWASWGPTTAACFRRFGEAHQKCAWKLKAEPTSSPQRSTHAGSLWGLVNVM